jgi:hypothetical protein
LPKAAALVEAEQAAQAVPEAPAVQAVLAA